MSFISPGWNAHRGFNLFVPGGSLGNNVEPIAPVGSFFFAPLIANGADTIAPLAPVTLTNTSQVTFDPNLGAKMPSALGPDIQWGNATAKMATANYAGKTLTLTAYLSPGNVVGAAAGTIIRVISWRDVTTPREIGFAYLSMGGGVVHFGLYDDGAAPFGFVDLGFALTDNTQCQIVLDLAGNANWYVNGVLYRTVAIVRQQTVLHIEHPAIAGQGYGFIRARAVSLVSV